ncbi:MAG: hypothetical protein ACK5IQ_08475 [Bacteroidales bacterium]
MRVIRINGGVLASQKLVDNFASELNIDKGEICVVVSELSGVGKIISDGLKSMTQRLLNPENVVLAICNKYKESTICNDLSVIKPILDELCSMFRGVYLTGDYSANIHDYMLIQSERMTTYLLQNALKSAQCEVSIIEPEQIPLKVTNEYGNASIDTTTVIESLFRNINEKIVLVPGSYGVTKDNRVARVGQSAADYTAAAIVVLTAAKKLELWGMDTPFYAFPQKAGLDSKVVECLDFSEASEMAYFNQVSMHPRVVEPLYDKNIPIDILLPNDGGEYKIATEISDTCLSDKKGVKCVGVAPIALLSLRGPGVGLKPGILATVTGEFGKRGINIRSVLTSQVCINLVIDRVDVDEVRKIADKLELPAVSEKCVTDNVTLVGVVGHQESFGDDIFKILDNASVPIKLMEAGIVSTVQYLCIDDKNCDEIINVIKNTL